MSLIPTLVTLVDGTVITAADHNNNYASIRDTFNTYAVLTDVSKTITVAHTWTAAQVFPTGTGIGAAASGFPFNIELSLPRMKMLSSGTNQTYFDLQNTGGRLLMGLENSAGGTLLTGTTAYNLVINVSSNTGIQFGTNNTLRAQITNGGIVLVGTTVTSGAAAGEIVLANAKSLRSVNSAATSSYSMIRLATVSGAETVTVGDGTNYVVVLGSATVTTNASGGDVVIANAKYLRAVNSGGTTTPRLIGLNGSNVVLIDPDAVGVTVAGAVTLSSSLTVVGAFQAATVVATAGITATGAIRTDTNYNFGGLTVLDSVSSKIRIGDSTASFANGVELYGGGAVRMTVNATGIAFFAGTPVAQSSGWGAAASGGVKRSLSGGSSQSDHNDALRALLAYLHSTAGVALLTT